MPVEGRLRNAANSGMCLQGGVQWKNAARGTAVRHRRGSRQVKEARQAQVWQQR